MIINSIQLTLLFLFNLAFVGCLTPIMRKIAIFNGILDIPNNSHKSHKKSVPYLGGVGIIISVLLTSYLGLAINKSESSLYILATSILLPALFLGIIGFWDDLHNLTPIPRLIAQSISGILVSMFYVFTNNLGNPTGYRIVDFFITTIWFVGICNAINFFDNLDGGAAGTVAISALALTLIALGNNQYLVASLSIVTSGATMGFLIWNKSPAKIYMGDAGSLFLGVIVAVLTIRLDPMTDSKISSFFIPILLLAIPILDTFVAVSSRLRRRISIFAGGQDHLSHRLIRVGLTREQAVATLWLLTLIFGLFAVSISLLSNISEFFVIVVSSLIWTILLYCFLKIKDF
jgi:UDP-GlcNAc:undecaprenyl-phosphate GlcNAc-1-phosphate transferase